MQISEAAGGAPSPGAEPCRFPKLEECAHFHYERVQLPKLTITLQTNIDQSLHSQHDFENDVDWYMVQVTSGDECWLLQRNLENFKLLDAQLHQCIYDRRIFQLPDLSDVSNDETNDLMNDDIVIKLKNYLEKFSRIADNSVNCGPVLNWLQMDNKGHRLLVPSEESRSINTPAVAAAYSVRRYVSQARDELNLEVGDMISVIDMASPGESVWWRGKRGFQVGFFPQHCVHIIGDKVPRNMPLPPPVVGSLALSPIKPVLRKHGKLITFFRSFILNRPSRRRLKQSGILRERVFGCDLGEHLLNSGHDIPTVLKCCAEFIETHGIVDGIYRLSGVTSNIQKLRNAFDEDRIPNLYTEEILQDIHSVASLLKMYFRELPNPLCTYQLYQSFVSAVQGCNAATRSSESDHDRLLRMREAVQKLPPPHYRTLEYLMKHLARVAKHGARTGMTTRNVAIVWAPNLLRCAELEIGGVAALQGVGVQAVVTEFLICYAHLIFCDHLPSLDLPIFDANSTGPSSPRKLRPKSLAISTPTKLITLEEARNKHLLNKSEECNYIEVGGGPKNLPKKYHTVIELPGGARKRNHTKRSPLGWRTLFSRSRNNSQGSLGKATRKASTPGAVIIAEKSITESDLSDMKRKLRSVKSAESLTSGHSEPASSNELDGLGPLYSLNKATGHSRSVSHDSYFDTLQNSQNNSEGSLLDLSEIQLNFELEESEMRIFSEDESLVSSPRLQKDLGYRRVLTRARPEEFSGSATNSGNPSPKKQARVVLSPESMSRKRTRLEDQLSDIQYIDCGTPDNIVSTMAVVHSIPDEPQQPRNKSPRNSDALESKKRHSLNLEQTVKVEPTMPKSLTEFDIAAKFSLGVLETPSTPRSPGYHQLVGDDSSTTDLSQLDVSPDYTLTTISITYKSPPRSIESSPLKSLDIYNVEEEAIIPTSTASLPIQQASQPDLPALSLHDEFLQVENEERPKSLGALDETTTSIDLDQTLKVNVSTGAICDNTNELMSMSSLTDQRSLSSGSNVQYTQSPRSSDYQAIDNSEHSSQNDLSLSEVVVPQSSTENLSTISLSSPLSKDSTDSPHVSPTINSYDTTPEKINDNPQGNDVKRKSPESEILDGENDVYQQVKFFRRSIHEVNALLDQVNTLNHVDNLDMTNNMDNYGDDVQEIDENNYDSLESDRIHVYENLNELTDGVADRSIYENVQFHEDDIQNSDNASSDIKIEKLEFDVGVISRRYSGKESLPPCLRMRNFKNQLKTRSLDEDEFKRELDEAMDDRRGSIDENLRFKTNSLPKRLNPPKRIPLDDKLNYVHLAHSAEKFSDLDDEELRRRERIEKYKEERRKFLHDKYRSESFKEDKDVLLSKLKIFNKNKDDLPKIRRKSGGNEDIDSLEDETVADDVVVIKQKPILTDSLKLRAAIFERNNSSNKQTDIRSTKKIQLQDLVRQQIDEDGADLEFVRVRKKHDDIIEFERRRHTFESREREKDNNDRRVSLEGKSSRREKKSPSSTYCIKDMKAIFESKSKQ